jgi:hypothetical protein
VRLGTTISFRLSEAARTTLTFQRRRPGRKVGRSCVKPTPANSGNRRCTRFVSVGSLGFQAKAGLRHVRFQGRLSGARSLGPGSYRLVASARDAAGNQGATRVGPTFTIVRE